MQDLSFPLVSGITEGARSGEDDPTLQLSALMGRLPRPNATRLAQAVELLEDYIEHEGESSVKVRVAAALSMLRGEKGHEGDTSHLTRDAF